MIIPEIELVAVPLKMDLLAVLIYAAHPAFKDRVETFHCFGVDVGIVRVDVFLAAMVHDAMSGELRAQRLIGVALITHEVGIPGNVLVQDGTDGGGRDVIHDGADDRLGLSVQNAHHLHLVVEGSFHRGSWLNAKEGLVHLHGAPVDTEHGKGRGAHGLTDPVTHEPGSFERDAKDPRQLVGTEPLFGRADQPYGLKPVPHGNVARLEDGPHLHGERLAALVALVDAYPCAGALQLANALYTTAVRTDWTTWPQLTLHVLIRSFLVVEEGLRQEGH